MLGLYNPVARTMRGLIQASGLPKVPREICTRKVSLGSFSETQALVDAGLLERVFADLSAQLPDRAEVPPAWRTQRWMARRVQVSRKSPTSRAEHSWLPACTFRLPAGTIWGFQPKEIKSVQRAPCSRGLEARRSP